MSFGFSVGDFIAVGKLIKDVSSCLQDIGGAKADYQELVRELECLQQALKHLNRLDRNSASLLSLHLDSIKYAALSCRRPLEQFLAKIQKHDKSLGIWGKAGVIASTSHKLQWSFGHKEEVHKLQNYLNIHVGTINILLAEHGLEKMDFASEKAAEDQLHIREQLEDTRSIVNSISGSLNAQALVVGATQKMTTRLYEMISGEFRTSWRTLGQMVAKVFVSTQQTYAILLEIKTSLAGSDTRWSFFQAPLAVEDALGYRFPVPSEYDFNLLEAVIQQRFRSGPGSLEVQAGNYEYFKTNNSSQVLTQTTILPPGMAITMAIIVAAPPLIHEACPMPRCGFVQTIECSGGGKNWQVILVLDPVNTTNDGSPKCHVWFSPATKAQKSLNDLLFAISSLEDSTPRIKQDDGHARANKRFRLAPDDEDVAMFKNVRVAQKEPVSLPSSSTLNSAETATIHAIFSSALNSPDPKSSMRYHGTYNQNEKDTREFLDTNAASSTQFLVSRSTPPTNATKRQPIFDDALSYLDQIRDIYAEQPEVYDQFLELMTDFKRGSADTPDVCKRVLDLFSSTPELIISFNQFLPPECPFLYSKQMASSNVDKGREGMIATITSTFHPDDSFEVPIRVVCGDVDKPGKRKRDAKND